MTLTSSKGPQRRSALHRDDEFARILATCMKLKEQFDKAKARKRITLYEALNGAYRLLVFCEDNAQEERVFDACNKAGIEFSEKNMFLAIAKLVVDGDVKMACKYACSLELAHMHGVHPNDFLTFFKLAEGVEACARTMAVIRNGGTPQPSTEGDQDDGAQAEPEPVQEVPEPEVPLSPVTSGERGYAEEKAAAIQAAQEAAAEASAASAGDTLREYTTEVIIDAAKAPPTFMVRRLDGSEVQLSAADCHSLKQLACKYAENNHGDTQG